MFLSSLTLCYIYFSYDRSDYLHPSPALSFKTSQVFLIHLAKCRSFSTIQSYAPNVALVFKSSFLVKRFFLLNAVFAIAVLDFISRLRLSIICYLATQVVELWMHKLAKSLQNVHREIDKNKYMSAWGWRKAVSITYSLCLFIALDMQYSKRMHRCILSHSLKCW